MKCAAVIAVVLAMACVGLAVNCYICSAVGCGEELDPSSSLVTIRYCTHGCFKTKVIAGSGSLSMTSYVRGCNQSPKSAGCSKNYNASAGIATVSGTTCFCTTDLCNAGSSVTVTPSMIYVYILCTAKFVFLALN
ncbi:uncharacterized protein LOC106172696 [Lingula anatina]|uniref:Uncharacterized protein LOC106172696 n=1 Tax=Lingula anatina TaxID=7574 RepID=A0A1S3JFN5_LINAN|nr:uncharacterized protein LOC106172696 [Lingula anatina]|eukprot:XP_013408961.1 uncharacterized protein LOC106172696 [Lingula anatina]